MSFLSRIFGRKGTSVTRRNETVVFDDVKVTRTLRDGREETLLWSDLEEVALITTDEGPIMGDVFWTLLGTTSGCLVPCEADGTKELLVRLQRLPGFKNEVIVQAMGSTENAKFVCWRKSSDG